MKVAIVHDYIKEYGGAERVLETLHEMYPKAPIYTLIYYPKFLGPHRNRFKDWDIRESSLGWVPFKHKLISPFRLLAPWVFKQFDFSEYDVVIVSATGAYTPNVIKTKSMTKHVCYCHTPPRYLYGYATAREWKKNKLFYYLALIANHFLRMVDYNSAQNVDLFIANSENVKARIKKFYRRDSVVVYPPVEVGNSAKRLAFSKNLTKSYELSAKSYYLAGGRLARPKHIDLIIKTCAELDIPLKVFGKGFAGYEEELKGLVGSRLRSNNIEMLGEVTDEEKYELMRDAKGFIFAGEDEDFGIIPVEAMMCGIPVIAYRSGGVVESVVDGKTGLFFDELNVESLEKAIKKFEKMKFDSKECVKQAQKFDKEKFVQGIKKAIAKV